MSFWDNIVQTAGATPNIGADPRSPSYAGVFPQWEIQTPAWPLKPAWNLMEQGYTLNEIIYGCINKRWGAIGDANLMVKDDEGPDAKEQSNHDMLNLIHNPNERIDEAMFWQISQIYMDTTGFALWEKELNNVGEPIRLWPMRPDWCSFYRGEGRLLRAVRYQPYSLPPIDIPIDNVVLFGYFDPRYPGLRFLGPTQVALRVMGVDSELTDFVRLFFQQGASTNGVLKTEQVLSDDAARSIQDRWMGQHGGVNNWVKPAVLGQGVSYQSTAQTFKDFQFDQVDARNEARICTVFDMPPILLSTKVGLQSATYSNYEEARKAWYEHWVTSQWKWLSGQVKMQLLPDFVEREKALKMYIYFKTDKVKALQEDRTSTFTRSTEAAKANVLTRDESRKEMGFDPIDNEPVFIGATVRETLTSGTGIVGPEDTTGSNTASTSQPTGSGVAPGAPKIAAPVKPGTPVEQAVEKKQFQAFAKKHTQDEVMMFVWKYTPADKAADLLREALGDDAPFQAAEDAAWATYGTIQSGKGDTSGVSGLLPGIAEKDNQSSKDWVTINGNHVLIGEEDPGNKGGITGKEFDMKDPERIEPVNETSKDKVDLLVSRMKEKGWQGDPILAYDAGDRTQAITGSHRIIAAREAGIDVPVNIIDTTNFSEADAETFGQGRGDDEALQSMTQLHDKGLVSDEQLRIMQDEVNGGGWEIQASREQQSKQPIVQTKIEVPKTEDKYVNKIGKTKLDNFLNSMHNKYNNIYQEMSDAEMDQLDYLESETYKP